MDPSGVRGRVSADFGWVSLAFVIAGNFGKVNSISNDFSFLSALVLVTVSVLALIEAVELGFSFAFSDSQTFLFKSSRTHTQASAVKDTN